MNMEHLSLYEASNNGTLGKYITGAQEEEKKDCVNYLGESQ